MGNIGNAQRNRGNTMSNVEEMGVNICGIVAYRDFLDT